MGTVMLRDDTASTTLFNESLPNPAIDFPATGWDIDGNRNALIWRYNMLCLQAQLYVFVEKTGHQYSASLSSTFNAAQTFTPPPTWSGPKTVRCYNGGTLLSTVTCNTEWAQGVEVSCCLLAIQMGQATTYTVT
jgi:hypothetical protein